MDSIPTYQIPTCSVGTTMYYPLRSGENVIVGSDAVVTQICGSGNGFCFQFRDEYDANYEIHHFMSWASVGILAFFSQKAAEQYISETAHNSNLSAYDPCNHCFTGIYKDCLKCNHFQRKE